MNRSLNPLIKPAKPYRHCCEDRKQQAAAYGWQGSSYGPPVRLEITNDTTDVVTWKIYILDNDMLGNPSATPILLNGGTISFDTWTPFVVMLIPDFQW